MILQRFGAAECILTSKRTFRFWVKKGLSVFGFRRIWVLQVPVLLQFSAFAIFCSKNVRKRGMASCHWLCLSEFFTLKEPDSNVLSFFRVFHLHNISIRLNEVNVP